MFKKINFNGDEIITVIDSGKCYVSIKHVCENLGMSKDQTKNQREKVSNDSTLKGGRKFAPLKTKGGIQILISHNASTPPLRLIV